MEVPVAQAGPPNAQSAPCTPPKSSQKIQDNDEEESNEEPVEFDDENVVSPSGESRHWKLLSTDARCSESDCHCLEKKK